MRPFAAVAAAAALLLLSGCTAIVPLQPAEDATNIACASMVLALPDLVGGRFDDQPQRETNAQGTGAYGNPTSVLVRCGVEPPAPTAELPCVRVEGVDWLRDDSSAPEYIFTTYGRTPAVQVTIDGDVATPGVVLYDLRSAVERTTGERQCVSIEDSLGSTGSATPTPTPTPTVTE